MELEEAKLKFIHSWGTLGSHWGINRTMAQIHALLLVSNEALSSNQVKDALNISMGNTNMNIRALMDWGLAYKEIRSGERKDFYFAEKDMWEVVKKIIIQRKRKELEPLTRALKSVSEVEGNDAETEEFRRVVQEIQKFSSKADSTLDNLVKADSNWFISTFMGMIK